jgi:hypothetical protein
LKGFHKLLATLIVFMVGAGVVAVVAKNNKTTSTAQQKPAVSTSSTESPTVTPTTSVKASHQVPAPTNSLKKSPPDALANVPPIPVTGVGRHPAGFVLVLLAGVLALWLRRTAHA